MPELADAKALMGIMWDPDVVERKQVTLLEPPGDLDLALKNTGDMRRQWDLRAVHFISSVAIGVQPR